MAMEEKTIHATCSVLLNVNLVFIANSRAIPGDSKIEVSLVMWKSEAERNFELKVEIKITGQ